MSYTVQDNELRTRFNTMWANRTPIEWPNATLALASPPAPPAPWCRFTITGGDDRKQTTIGADTNNFKNTGSVIIQIFVPSNSGDAIANQRADEVIAIFQNWGGTNILCRAGSKKTVGNDGSGYFQVNAIIPFIRNELQ